MFKKFRYWFTNVYWYHYRLHTVIAIIAAALIGSFIHAAVTRVNPDFMFVLAAESPVAEMQGEALAQFFTQNTDVETEIQGSVLYIDGYSDASAVGWQRFSLAIADEEYSILIIGESLIPVFEEQWEGFVPMEELGIVSSAARPALAPLSGVTLMDELGFGNEPMYALIKRPRAERDASVNEEDALRYEKSVACLQALFGV